MKRRSLTILAGVALLTLPAFANDEHTEKVRGFFCDGKSDHVAFLLKKAEGENDIMAANAVNKSLGKASCADYLPATAVPTGEKTVMSDGLVFKLQSFIFLPEKVERWTGTVLGSLQQTADKQDI
jgi:hypothetical protein